MIPVSQTGLVATADRNLAPLLVGGAVVLLAAGAIAVVAIRPPQDLDRTGGNCYRR